MAPCSLSHVASCSRRVSGLSAIERRRVARVVGNGGHIGADFEQSLRRSKLAALARVVKGLVDLGRCWRGLGGQEFVEPGQHAQPRGDPEALDRGPALD